MNRYILHRKSKGKEHIKYLIAGAACLIMAGAVGYTAHSIGTARAKSREIVPIYTEEELEYYLLDTESEEYNLKGRYRLEADLDLGWLYQSIGTDVEPFAGTFDGNGHVISGLERPLFGVLKQAEVENLFLSEASIVNPVTYFDGEHYVDGYGALAGYVIGSEIRNCGAGGSLVTDNPVETVYQTAKAKPEPELEEIGPGMTESSGESLDGLETESGLSAGGPGVVETSAGEGGNQESLPGENGSSPENAGTSAESGEGMTGSQEETKETSAGETPDAETDLGEAGTGQENGGEGKPGGDIKTGDGTETPGETGNTGGTGNPGGAGTPGETETPADTEVPAGPEHPTVPPETPAGPESSATQEPTATPEPTASPEAPAGTEVSPEPETIAMETRAYLRLMMKNAAITEVGLDNMATPSDADAVESSAESLPVEAELPAPISSPSDAGMAEEETEFNPYEDTFINVTAERVIAGGLIGQAEEGTTLSSCFTCMTIESRLNLSDTYTGGFAGILGWDVSVENSYSTGYMECDGISAGFVAMNNGTIQNSYSSMALAQGEDTFCHAFTAEGEGQYIDCFYDMQLADVETDTADMDGEVAIFENDTTESMMGQDNIGVEAVTGLSTRTITGIDAEVGGDWYLTGNAYPQISYFALNEHGIIADYSKVSAIPLLLPEGVTLSHALGDTADLLILPGEIEGQEIQWEAGGDIAIDDSRQVLVSGKTVGLISAGTEEEEGTAQAEDGSQISFSPREPVLVQSALNESQETDTDAPQPASSNGNLKASIGSISKTFSLSGSEGEISAGSYADWNAVGKAVYDGTLPMPETDTDGAYLLSQPSHLAWFMYMVNEAGETGIHGKLTADINMDGTAETDVFTVLNTEWCPIGNAEAHAFTGEFDGNGHTISAIKIEQEQTLGNAYGLFGYARDARIQNLYLGGTEILLAGTKPVSAGSLIGQSAGNTVVFRIGVKNSRIQISSSAGAVHGGGVVGNHETGALDFSACYARDTVIESEASGDNCETAAGLVTVNGMDAGAAESSVRSAYFTGTASILGGGTSPQSGAGTVCLRGGADTMVTNIYYNSIARSTPEGSQAGEELTREQLTGKEGTYLLNGENVTGVWAYSEGELPEMSLYEARLTFSNWIEVGEALDNGTLGIGEKPPGDGTEANPYQISTPEQLAWFSYRVWQFNDTDGAICGDLTKDIDLLGETYGGTADAPLGWIPIGRNLGGGLVGKYSGKFGQNHERIYQIRNMNVNGINAVSRYSGLFGYCCGEGMIRRIGIESGIFNGILAGGIVGQMEDNAVIEECYNKVSMAPAQDSYHYMGGIAGGCGGNSVIRNCFNLGSINSGSGGTGTVAAGGIVGRMWTGAQIINCFHGTGSVTSSRSCGAIAGESVPSGIINCYYETGLGVGDSKATGISKNQLQSWAAAYALNGGSVDGPWAFTEGEYPGVGTLDPAPCWGTVTQGIRDGLITADEASTNADGAYEIDTAEKLALFARDVNDGTKTTVAAKLTANIDLMGHKYGGTPDVPIRWTPIGTADNTYQGTFIGPGVIANMRVEQAGVGGLFGYVGSGAMIGVIGLDTSCSVITTAPADGGDSGTAALVGIIKNVEERKMVYIMMCYSRASVHGHSSNTGAIVGQAIGTLTGVRDIIGNSYAAGTLSTSSGTVGAIAGCLPGDENTGSIVYSYWDNQTSSTQSLDAVSQGNPSLTSVGPKTTAELKNDEILSLLNPGGSSWIRSDDRNNGYPSFSGAPAVYTSWEDVGKTVSEPSSRYPSSSITPGAEGNPYLVKSPEDLAWFAYQVNLEGRNSLCGELRSNINLYGSFYNGENAYNPDDSSAGLEKALRWIPIGSDVDGKRYTGTFNGNGYTVSAMLAKGTENQGLFGTLGDNATIKKTSISDSRIEVTSMGGGGIAGYVNGTGVKITECGNKGSLSGTVGYFGGCVGVSSEPAELILDGCYNIGNISVPGGRAVGGIVGFVLGENGGHVTIRNCMNMGKVEGDAIIGGIVGGANSAGNTAGITVTGCWNAETVTAAASSSLAGSIIGVYSGSADDIKDCLIDENYDYGSSWNNPVVKKEAFGTWGAAWWLNGGSFKQTTGLSWTYDKDSEYPVLSTTGLSSAESWEQVGEALEYGLLKDMEKPTEDGNSNPYLIQTPEQLAWLAYVVNNQYAEYNGKNARLEADINLFGSTYTTFTGDPVLENITSALPWKPMGDASARTYKGAFDGGGHEVDGMHINGKSCLGLFGIIEYPSKIWKLGIGANSKVVGSGEACGMLVGGAWVVNGGGCEITDCYNLGTLETENKWTGVFVGDDMGVCDGFSVIISNCYNAGSANSFAMIDEGSIDNCYADISVNSNNGVFRSRSGSGVTKKTTEEMKTSEVAAALNTYDETLKTGTDRVWYTSLNMEKTKGYPTFQAPTTVKVTFAPDTMGADGKEVTLPDSLSIPDMKLRAIGLTDENFTPGRVPASDSEFQLVAEGSIKGTDSGYSSYGYTNANKNVAVKAGTVDLQPVVSTASLNNPVTSLGTVDKVALNIAAAYTRSTQRNLLLEGASGNDRYEICIAIAGVTSKSLVVDLPLKVAMADELMPDGTEKTAYSVDTAIQNRQNYPMEGKILKAVPISKTDIATYQALKPIAKTTNYGSGQIYEAGVRLGITNPKTGTEVISGDLYYNPDATGDTNPWMTCQLKAAGGTLPYRYFLKYKADPYYDSEHPNFGYTISYQFGLMADDYSAAAGAVAFQ